MKSVKKFLDTACINNLENRFPKKYYNNYNNSLINDIPTKNVDYYVVKPFGKKCYLWFTYIDKRYITLIKFLNDSDFYEINLDFDNTLSYNNVLLYGYFLTIDNSNYFLMDTIINYNNYNHIISEKKCSLESMFKIYNKLFSYINNNVESKFSVKIFLPYITNDYTKLFNSIYNLAYIPYGVSIWSSNKNLGVYKLNNSYNYFEGIFKIKAHPNHDTYKLYYNNNNKLDYYGRCIITDYKLSIYMNSIYRNIVENKNLDLLEESEDEEIFQNIDENKYVDLDKCIYFKCHFNKRFKKWVPKSIVENCNFDDIITKKEVIFVKKK